MRRSLLVLLLLSSTALAQTANQQATAVALFNDAKQLLKDGKTAEACKKFEASRNLYPALGTRLNLADCYAKLGRTMSAWAEFREAAVLAKKDGDNREQFARDQMAKLEPNLSYLTITVAAPTPGIVIKTDDTALDEAAVGTALPIDPGDHTISASAPGYDSWSQKVTFGDKQKQTVTVPALVKSKIVEAPKHPFTGGETPPPSGSGRKTAGFVVGGIGVAAVAVGLVFGAQTMSKWDTAKKDCPNDVCMTQAGVDAANSAKTFGNISTGLVIAGGALVATGIVLIVTAPKHHSVEVSATVGPVNGIVAWGRF